ncbi:hypothetical protein [Clostridium sp. B9]|uniref:hypothetical protein n=1 Tax=Clostridium sp. B9 TaxID=3423224 RepID=UPI003D2EB8D7
MNLNYIFSLFIFYCKKLLSKECTKLLFCFIISQIVLILISKKDYNNKISQPAYKKYKLKRKLPILLANNTNPSIDSSADSSSDTFKIPLKITSNIKHLKNSTHFKQKDLPIKTFNFDKITTSLPPKTPILLNDFSIVESFVGNICFYKYILNIKNIRNNLILKSSTLILDNDNRKCGVLFLSGYLEIDLMYSIPDTLNLPIISSTKNYVIRVPFSSALHVKFENEVSGDKFYFTNLNICLKDTKYSVNSKLINESKLDNDISLFNAIRLSTIVNYSVELYDFSNDK